MAYRSSTSVNIPDGSGANLTGTLPAGTAAGDRLVISITQDVDGRVFTPPGGENWVLVYRADNSAPDRQSHAVYEVLNATGTETCAFTSSAVQRAIVQVAAFSGRDTATAATVSTPVIDNNNNATPISVALTGLTAPANSDLVWIAQLDQATSGDLWGFSSVSGFTSRQDVSNGDWITATLWTQDNNAGGATGTITGTATRSSGANGAGYTGGILAIPVSAAASANTAFQVDAFQDDAFQIYGGVVTSSGSSGTVAYTNANDTLSAAGTTAVTGSLSRTNANDTSAASGATTITGTLARTNANDSIVASGSPVAKGTLATTNANDTLAASGSVGAAVTGTLAYTNANDTLAASGTTTATGTLAKTNANDTSAASGSTTVTGTLAKTNANDTLSASGSPVSSGSLAYTNANDTLAASGSTGSNVTGTLAYTNANDTLVASGSPVVSGALAKTNANDTLSASGSPIVSGTLARTNANDTLAASGAAGAVSGTVAYTNNNDVLSAAGSGGELMADTHDGWWAKQHKKKKPIETLEEAQELVEKVVAKAAKKPVFVPASVKLPSTIDQQIELAERLLAYIRQNNETDDEEALMLLL